MRNDEALAAWKMAFKLARDDIERQGVYIHFARININAGQFDEARKNLNAVTNGMFTSTKNTLTKKLTKLESKGQETNTPPARTEKKLPADPPK